MRQIVLDTETTGLSTEQGHRIIEIGCIEMVNRRLTGRDFHRFLNPDRDIDAGAEAVHGISRADLEMAPRFPEIVEEFLEFVADAELVIHNAEFDVGFIEHELRLMKHPKAKLNDHCTILDTLKLAREMHPGQRNSLDALCKRYEVDASNRNVHGALIDSELLARVYLAMTGGQTALLLGDDGRSGRETATGGHVDGRGASRGLTTAPTADSTGRKDLKVIKATPDELAAHDAILEKIRQGGVCVWDDVV